MNLLCFIYSSFLLILISISQACIPPPGYEPLSNQFDSEVLDRIEKICQLDCNCPQTYLPPDPVCGTDGQTYPGHCALNCYACKFNKRVKVAYFGECDQAWDPMPR